MFRVMVLMMLLLACGRTEPVRPGPRPPVFPCELSVEPRAIDFGELAQGGRASRSLVVRNLGDGLCSLDALALGELNDPTFSFEGAAWPRVLGPDESLTLTVSFFAGAPVLPAVRKGTLQVRTSNQDEPEVTVALHAKVVFCRVVASPDPLDLGNVTLNTTRTGTVTLTNAGSIICAVSGLRLGSMTDANFTLPTQISSFTINPGASASGSVQFAARTSAPPHLREGHLEFESNDAVSPHSQVALSAFINTICTEAGQFIYTVDNDGRFSRFDPLTLVYHRCLQRHRLSTQPARLLDLRHGVVVRFAHRARHALPRVDLVAAGLALVSLAHGDVNRLLSARVGGADGHG